MTAVLLDPREHDETGIAELASESVVVFDPYGKIR
jgi:hypothetical protein